FLHVVTDLAAFAGTALAGGLVLATGWDRFDPIASLLVAALIFWSSFSLLRESTRILLEVSPDEPREIAGEMLGVPGVVEVHDLHVWTVGSGFGAAIAQALKANGARVAGGARRADRLETDIALELDVTDPASCERFVADAVQQLGGLDILVNNAGLGLGRDPFDKSTEQDEETVLETNVHGVLRMTRLCLPHLRDGGHIVNMGSIAGRQAYENAAVYVASKYAVRGFTYA